MILNFLKHYSVYIKRDISDADMWSLSGILKSNSRLFEFHQLRYLDLNDNHFISSSLPSKFGHLNRLEVLYLFSNGFIGQIPSSFSNLSMLTYLDLSGNQLTGSLPHLRNLTKLILLDLFENHFFETLNPNSSLFELHQLRYLGLDDNDFSSSLPLEIGNLHRLENFYLSANGFFGQIPPTLSNLTQLNELSFAQNNFTGPIPSSLFTMPFLSILDLRDNHLTGSALVPNSSTLETLYLSNNLFEGQILEPISKLTTLIKLDLSFLNINHPIDLRLFSSLKSLSYLDLSGNSISPTILSSDLYLPLTLRSLFLRNCSISISEFPNILKTLENLEYLSISINKIKGKVPEWLWKLPRLKSVDIQGNSFNGFEGSLEVLVNSSVEILILDVNKFKGTFSHLPLSIKLLSANDNRFTGKIPLSFCNRSSFSILTISKNNFTGPVPQCLSNFKIVDLRNNNLQGSIPDKFYADTTLQILNLDYNRLSGKLPKSFVNCSSLEFLSLENNRIKDTFPFWLKDLPNLQMLILRSNKFYGPISPPHQGPLGFPELQILEISDNEFTGSLSPNYFLNWKISSSLKMNGGLYMLYEESPYGLFTYTYMDHIDLQYKGLNMEQAHVLTFYSAIGFSGNKLEGKIPESIGLLKALIALNLSNNAFTGQIPLSLANLKELESLDLSRNQLSGTIPSGLGTLSFLAYVNVSHNQLKGEIPQGTQIIGQPKSSFEGNAELCGLPLVKNCFASNESPPTQHVEEEEEMVNCKAEVVGYGLGLILGMSIAQFIGSYKPEWFVKIIGPTKRRNR